MALDQETLNRMFANAFSPIDTLGRGQLVVAEDRLNRQRILDDAARRIFQENASLEKQQSFSRSQAEAERVFRSTEAGKARQAAEDLATKSEERQLAVIEKQQDAIEKRAEEARKEARKVLDSERRINTDTYVRLKKDADKLEREVVELGTIPRSVRNQWAAEIAQKNGANATLLKSAFDPSSASDISLNFNRLGDKAILAADELEKKEAAYFERIRPQLILKSEELKGIKDEARTLVRNVDFSLIPESRRDGAAADLRPQTPAGAPQGAPSDITAFLSQSGAIAPETVPAMTAASPTPGQVTGLFPSIGKLVGGVAGQVAPVAAELGAVPGSFGAALFGGTMNPAPVPEGYTQSRFSRPGSITPIDRAQAVKSMFPTQSPLVTPSAVTPSLPAPAPTGDMAAKIQQTKDAIRNYAKRTGISDIQIEDIILRADAGDAAAKAEVMRLAQQLKAESEQANRVIRSDF